MFVPVGTSRVGSVRLARLGSALAGCFLFCSVEGGFCRFFGQSGCVRFSLFFFRSGADRFGPVGSGPDRTGSIAEAARRAKDKKGKIMENNRDPRTVS